VELVGDGVGLDLRKGSLKEAECSEFYFKLCGPEGFVDQVAY